jgi:hypothetical protein
MDLTTGARQLDWQIRCHQHWRQARAVRDGLQSARDPDADDLIELGDGIRLYLIHERGRASVIRNGGVQLRKTVVDGWWNVT